MTAQWLFVNLTYYCLMAAVLCWAGTYLYQARGVGRETVVAWTKENWPGLVLAATVTLVTAFAVEPALRMLSDEANLVGTSKNLWASKTATFTISGKNYYGSSWDVDVSIDQRPALFPFFVSLVHAVRGYSFENAFHFNLLVLPIFLLVAYRLAKSLGGETLGIVAATFVAAHPITLLAVRSGGFDFLATFFGLLVVKALFDVLHDPTAGRLASLWMNACLFSEVRYESALFLPLVVAVVFAFRMITWTKLRKYAFVYALTPVYLLPRVAQSIVRGNVPAQEPGTVTFSAENFSNNVEEYLAPLFSPEKSYPFHSAPLIALGIAGCSFWLYWLFGRVRAREWKAPATQFGLALALWMLLQAVILFSYVWGRAQTPSAARLFLPIDTCLSFAAAWVVCRTLRRFGPLVPQLLAVAFFVAGLPGPAQDRALNRLTQTRESATTWRFFERLNEKRILIVTDRPNHFTIMDYGAMNFETARRDPYLFTALSRRLFYDVYVIQQIQLATNQPLSGYEIWPDKKLDTVLEFQNDANVLVRVSRVPH